MIRGAIRRTTIVDTASYVAYAVAVLVIALLLPGRVNLPDWLIFTLMIGVQLWLYKRFYGRL